MDKRRRKYFTDLCRAKFVFKWHKNTTGIKCAREYCRSTRVINITENHAERCINFAIRNLNELNE